MKSSEENNLIEKSDENKQASQSLTNSENNFDLNDKDIMKNNYSFGWSRYSEITNGRFAMLGFSAILIIELISNQSFLHWAGIIR